MKTEIQPILNELPFGETYGFYVGREFIPMNPHKGHVYLVRSTTGRPRFIKSGSHRPDQEYTRNVYTLEVTEYPLSNMTGVKEILAKAWNPEGTQRFALVIRRSPVCKVAYPPLQNHEV